MRNRTCSRIILGKGASVFHTIPRGIALAIAIAATPVSDAFAHCFVGARFLPATLNTDDPCVADEMSLPTISTFKTPDDPPARELDIEADFSKRFTEDFGVTAAWTWTQIRRPDGTTTTGFQDLQTAFQYQLLKDGPHELAVLVGLVVNWGGTGATNAGLGTSYSTLSPTFYIGRGFGELPDSIGWARPFAVTAEVGYNMPTSSFDLVAGTPIPQTLTYSGSLQYSMPYLKSNVVDLGLPDFINHLIPIVEVHLQTPIANNFGNSFVTTGTINPGVIWVGSYFQVGLEAIIPVNRDSGSGVGAMGQIHFYLDDMFPTTLGQPLFGAKSTPAAKPMFGG
jgi:hypothetical protein